MKGWRLIRAAFRFEPRDLWVGLYWVRDTKTRPGWRDGKIVSVTYFDGLCFYACPFPALAFEVLMERPIARHELTIDLGDEE